MLILCATDMLPRSAAAVERAKMMACQLGAALRIVHVVPSEREAPKARIALAQLERRLSSVSGRNTVTPGVLLLRGSPAQQLGRILQKSAPDLLVLGPRHRHLLRGRLGGSLAERILGVHCFPLLLVKRTPVGSYRRVLLALDLSSAAREIVRTVQPIVSRPGVGTSVVHAFEPRFGTLPYIPRRMESVGAANSPERADAERAVRLLLSGHGNGLRDSNLILSAAFPAEAIVSSVSRLQPDLLVMGARGYGRFRRALLGSTATQVLDAVPCDVLLVPRGAKLQSRRRLHSHRPEKGTQTLA